MEIDFKGLFEGLRFALEWPDRRKKVFAKQLNLIADTLEEVGASLLVGSIPTQQAHRLATLVNFANDARGGFIRFRHIDTVFEVRLPKIGRMMRGADVFIDGKPREDAHDFGVEARTFDYVIGLTSSQFDELFREVERAQGELRGAAAALSGGDKPGA